MGVDLHGLRLLQYAVSAAPLGDVATLGRQCVHIDHVQQAKFLIPPPVRPYGPYCEELLAEHLGATSITSFDASDYEHATIVHDMNKPLDYGRQFDTVIDFGTLEHVFNIPVALRNMATLCKIGGRIIHSLPANNFSGHGFYQFSPELFFSLYSAKNGFADTEVFVAEIDDTEHWWKSAVPAEGIRVEYTSPQRSYILVLSRKATEGTTQFVQQSDYIVNWKDGEVKSSPRRRLARDVLNKFLKGVPLVWRLADTIAKPVNAYEDAEYHRLSDKNPGYNRVSIENIIRSRQ